MPEKAAVPLDGAALFHERGCEYCHGGGGAGTERGPSLLGVGKKLRPDQISRQIHEGGGAMPAFGEALTTPEIDALGRYLQTLKPAPAPKRKTATVKKTAGELQ